MTGVAHTLIPMASDRPESGIFHRHTIQIQELTSEGVVIIDETKQPRTVIRIPCSTIDNVLVMNQHSIGTGYHYTVGSARYVRNCMGFNSWHGNPVGDVCFMSGGVMRVIFKQIADPHSVCNLAKSQIHHR